MTPQDINDLITFHRNLSEKCARAGNNATLAFSGAANECERYRERHFPFMPTQEQIERAISDFKETNQR